MNKILIAFVLASLAGGSVLAQSSPVAAPAPGETPQNLNPSSATTTVTVAPDPAATSMADPQSAAQFGSPSAVDSPSSPMPNPNGWPPIKPSAKRPSWVKKAPASSAPTQTTTPH
ncbi:MAG TPA: hypothetical protein VGI30_13565 [Caulobacteraceae bacterium]|jgi:hypothetical protein